MDLTLLQRLLKLFTYFKFSSRCLRGEKTCFISGIYKMINRQHRGLTAGDFSE